METKLAPSAKENRRQALGKQGEDIAAAWLEARGMTILMRNYRCKIGEIDIIGKIGNMTVFVEVRSRSSAVWGIPAESVNYKKQQKLRKAASCYFAQKRQTDSICRFDVISILYDQHGNTDDVEWFADAF